jgi:hypothetical protein
VMANKKTSIKETPLAVTSLWLSGIFAARVLLGQVCCFGSCCEKCSLLGLRAV